MLRICLPRSLSTPSGSMPELLRVRPCYIRLPKSDLKHPKQVAPGELLRWALSRRTRWMPGWPGRSKAKLCGHVVAGLNAVLRGQLWMATRVDRWEDSLPERAFITPLTLCGVFLCVSTNNNTGDTKWVWFDDIVPNIQVDFSDKLSLTIFIRNKRQSILTIVLLCCDTIHGIAFIYYVQIGIHGLQEGERQSFISFCSPQQECASQYQTKSIMASQASAISTASELQS